MKKIKHVLTTCLVAVLMSPYIAWAGDGNWKMGRIYYRMVCTACHKSEAGKSIAPSTMKKAEWEAYLAADSHAAGKDKLSYYVSMDYRNSIKDSNRAAAKFSKVPNDKMTADLKAFVMHGAKDGPSPARCN